MTGDPTLEDTAGALKPLGDLLRQCAGAVRGVLFDIDDTFTLHGKIPSEAYSALWRLHEKGFILVPITGRPAGWCDHIARMWPVDGIVGENGAFYYSYSHEKRKLIRRNVCEPPSAGEKGTLTGTICNEAMRRVPRCAVAADQPFRIFDLAIDFAEDVPCLSDGEIREICAVFREHGAAYKVSSIHVNGWFGQYNKLTTARLFLEEHLGIPWEAAQGAFIFTGDSPNDEPMFEAFPLSVGVANVRRFLPVMKHRPAFITSQEGGRGFAEMAGILLDEKQ